MKNILALLFIFLGVQAFGQTYPVTSNEPFKKSNAILLRTTDSTHVALKKLASILVTRGYTIEKIDSEFNTLVTKPKTLPKGFNPVLTVQAVGTAGANAMLTLTGSYSVTAGQYGTNSQAQYSGVEGSANKSTFAELSNAAKEYPQGQIQYTQR